MCVQGAALSVKGYPCVDPRGQSAQKVLKFLEYDMYKSIFWHFNESVMSTMTCK